MQEVSHRKNEDYRTLQVKRIRRVASFKKAAARGGREKTSQIYNKKKRRLRWQGKSLTDFRKA